MVEIFCETLASPASFQSMVMFGLYVKTEKNKAEVYRAVYRGDTWLPISDAFNRLMS